MGKALLPGLVYIIAVFFLDFPPPLFSRHFPPQEEVRSIIDAVVTFSKNEDRAKMEDGLSESHTTKG